MYLATIATGEDHCLRNGWSRTCRTWSIGVLFYIMVSSQYLCEARPLIIFMSREPTLAQQRNCYESAYIAPISAVSTFLLNKRIRGHKHTLDHPVPFAPYPRLQSPVFSGVTHALDLERLDVVIFHPPGHRRPSRFIRMSIWLEQQNIKRNKRRYDVAKGLCYYRFVRLNDFF